MLTLSIQIYTIQKKQSIYNQIVDSDSVYFTSNRKHQDSNSLVNMLIVFEFVPSDK